MANETLLPTAISTFDQWGLEDPLVVTTGKIDAITDGISTTGIQVTDAADNGKIQTFTFAPMVATNAVVTSVSLVVDVQVTLDIPGFSGEYKAYWDLDGASIESNNSFSATTSIVTETIVLTHPFGRSWTVAEVDRLKAGIKAYDIDLCQTNCWELELLVQFTAGGLPIQVKLSSQMDGMTTGPLT